MKRVFFKLVYVNALISILLISSCSESTNQDSTNDSTEVVTHTPETLQKEIEELEKAVANPDTPNHDQVALQLIDFYETYARIFSTNEMAPEMLFRGGNQAVNIEDYDKALLLYAEVEKNYREFQKRPECIFLQGFVYENYKNQLGNAKERYESLIAEYPSHALATQAQQSILYLGMSDEDRIKSFQK